MAEITIAFIKKGERFVPSHVSEIQAGDVYYLVADGKPTERFKATQNAVQDGEHWNVTGEAVDAA